MTTTGKLIIAFSIAVVLVAAFAVFVLTPAHSSSPTIRQKNAVDHIDYTTTAKDRQLVTGTDGDDVIHGNKVGPGKPAQVINALAGNDRVWGGKGADEINGDAGNDRLHGYHAGADTINGGPGRDVCVIGETPNGHTNDELVSCEKIKIRDAQGHG